MNERKCSHCGSEKYYAKGLCMPCYMRLRRNGTVEYKQRGGGPIAAKSKEIVSLKTSGIKETKIAELVGVSRQYVYAVLSRYYRQTNLARIREMNAEELASLLAHNPWMTEKSALDWLQSPADGGDWDG